VTSSSQTQAQLLSSQTSPKPQPPQPARHSTTQIVRLHRSVGASAPTPQSAGHWYEHVVVSQTNEALPLGGGREGCSLHWYAQVAASHVKSDDGGGEPQSAGQSQVQLATLHSAPPSQPPQSAGQRYSHVVGSQTACGPGAVAPPQSAGQA
jgi:hypothetical protein